MFQYLFRILIQKLSIDLGVYAFIFDEIFLINIPEKSLKYYGIFTNICLFCKILP